MFVQLFFIRNANKCFIASTQYICEEVLIFFSAFFHRAVKNNLAANATHENDQKN